MAQEPPYSKIPTGELIQMLIQAQTMHGGGDEIAQELDQRFMQIDHARKEQVDHDLEEYRKSQRR